MKFGIFGGNKGSDGVKPLPPFEGVVHGTKEYREFVRQYDEAEHRAKQTVEKLRQDEAVTIANVLKGCNGAAVKTPRNVSRVTSRDINLDPDNLNEGPSELSLSSLIEIDPSILPNLNLSQINIPDPVSIKYLSELYFKMSDENKNILCSYGKFRKHGLGSDYVRFDNRGLFKKPDSGKEVSLMDLLKNPGVTISLPMTA